MVSHDRYLLDNITNRTLELENGKIANYLGNYSYYKEKKKELARLAKEKEQAQIQQEKNKKTKIPKINKSKLKEEIKNLEDEIEKLEKRIDFLSAELAKPENYQAEEKSKQMIVEYKAAERDLPQLYEKWDELNNILISS